MSYAGYSPVEAKAIAKSIDDRADNLKHREYLEYVGEARACGYEVCSFAEWKGEASPKAEASLRWAEIDSSDLDLY